MRRLALIAGIAALALAACTPSTSGNPLGSTGQKFAELSRAPLDFAINTFDAALYGLDFAIAIKKIEPGSDRAKQIAALGRQVQGFLNAAEAARDAGNAVSYDEAFRKANEAMTQFKALLGSVAGGGMAAAGPPLTAAERTAVLERAAG